MIVDLTGARRRSQMGPGAGDAFCYGVTVVSATRSIELVVARSSPDAATAVIRNDIRIIAPGPLAGSHITVVEHPHECHVAILLTTAARWYIVAPAHHHQDIPLIGLGYLDVMSRPHPLLSATGDVVSEWSDNDGRVIERHVRLDSTRTRIWQAVFDDSGTVDHSTLPLHATISMAGAERPSARVQRTTPALLLPDVATAVDPTAGPDPSLEAQNTVMRYRHEGR